MAMQSSQVPNSGMNSMQNSGGINPQALQQQQQQMAQQMQASTSQGGYPGFQGNNLARAGVPNAMQQQAGQMPGPSSGPQNVNELNQRQRQLFMLQQGQGFQRDGALGSAANPAAGPNPSINPQFYATMRQQEQQQRMAMAQRQGTPMMSAGGNSNTGMSPVSAGDGSNPGQYSMLRQNPSVMPGIARSTRSPSVTAETSSPNPNVAAGSPLVPRQGNEEYQRAMLAARQQAAQRNVSLGMMQNMASGFQGQGQQSAWPQQPQQQQVQQQQLQAAYAMNNGMGQGVLNYGANSNVPSPNPAAVSGGQSQQMWSGQYSHAGSPSGSVHPSEHAGTPRHASATPAPIPHNSPPPQANENEFSEFFNINGPWS